MKNKIHRCLYLSIPTKVCDSPCLIMVDYLFLRTERRKKFFFYLIPLKKKYRDKDKLIKYL